MAEYFVYIDETGALDFLEPRTASDSPYFGVGSVSFKGNHPNVLWDMLALRLSLEEQQVWLPKGFHAKNDTIKTRAKVFSVIGQSQLDFHATFLYKAKAHDYVQEAGEMRLYKLALYFHLSWLCKRIFAKDDHLYIVLATFSAKSEKAAAKSALYDISKQMPQQITPCYWDSASSVGLQVADYMLWGLQRRMFGKKISDCGVCG